ncbi:MAG: WcbI family polysaccharide biosynthesis putative acetyltransferase [Cyanobium sp.]
MSHQALLDRVAEALKRPSDAATLLSLAFACHAGMLELSDDDKILAARLALAGAKLFDELQSNGHDTPDWQQVHEEQCCRYGCIWIHELLAAGSVEAQAWVADALRLLARMEQLRQDPVDWAPGIRSQLLNHQSKDSSVKAEDQDRVIDLKIDLEIEKIDERAENQPYDRRVVVVGNCQCHPLMLGLRQALPQARIHFCPSVHLATADDVARLHQRLGSADLLVTHRIQPGYRNGIGLDTASLRKNLPESGQILVLPNLHYEGHHPFIGYAQDPDGQLASLEPVSPLGGYHDFLAMAAAAHAIEAGQLLLAPTEAAIDHIRQCHRQSIQELQLREQDCDIEISDWIATSYRQQPLMHTINHPNQACLDQLLRRLIKRIDPNQPLEADVYDSHEHLGEFTIPIHPWVQQALGLGAWSQAWGQQHGEAFSIEKQLEASIRFYQDHPWIGRQNHTHPKFAAAQQLLLEPNGKPHQTPSPGLSQKRQPTLAALINYYDDVEMLAWQYRSGCLDPYDRIYIWDGPYQYRNQLGLGETEPGSLADTSFGRQLIADSRVVYRHGTWTDEAVKRIEIYAAISEDLIVLHDTDEFFCLDRNMLDQFWNSGYGVASHRIQNLYAGGFLGSDPHHRSGSPDTLPHKRIIFRRNLISPAQHLDYLWLVGVAQNPADESRLCPQPLGSTLHLTGCRSTQGQIGKMSFYKCLALSKQAGDPVLNTLRTLISTQELTSEEALLIYLRGDPGFAGIPHPDFGLSLQPRFQDPRFPATTLDAILSESNQVNIGTFQVLEGYPLALWFPSGSAPARLRISCQSVQPLDIRSWLWLNRQPALESMPLQLKTEAIQITLPANPELMGVLVQIRLQASTPTPRCQIVQVSEG